MKYQIFGAGHTGKMAADFLGIRRIRNYIDNKAKGEYYDKPIITLGDFLASKNSDDIIVVASDAHFEEIEKQLKDNGISRYFVFHEYHPWEIMMVYPGHSIYKQFERVDYARILATYNIYKYRNVAIMGETTGLPYLISESMIQSNSCNVKEIIAFDKTNIGKSIMGIPYVAWDKESLDCDCLIINSTPSDNKYLNSFEELDLECDVIHIYESDVTEKAFYNNTLIKYKDIHKGKRIFVVGNGPSLKIEDLDRLYKAGEICFGFNKVYRAYSETSWRADYLGFTDYRLIDNNLDEISEVPGTKFITDGYVNNVEAEGGFKEGFEKIHIIYEGDMIHYPHFSTDITYGVYDGGTVTYDLGIQLAAYMGASEIYLIGVDNNYVGTQYSNNNYFISNYNSQEEMKKYKEGNMPDKYNSELTTYSFISAKEYAKRLGIKIYNATRGGKLDVFERVEFDSLF